MKKLVFGLIATVMFGFVGSAQTKTDFEGSIKELGLNPVSSTVLGKIKITISWEAGRWCFKDDPGCKGSVVLKTAPKKNGKFDLSWNNVEPSDFKMPNAKLFGPETNGTKYYIFIPQQSLVLNKETKEYEAVVEFYSK
jgi:hypothetical protein